MAIPMPEKEPANQRWLPVALLVAIVYPAVGIAFAVLVNLSGSTPILIWRLAAWFVSAAAFGAHLAHEHLRLRSSPLRAALHASSAVAVGAFVLAVWVNVRGYLVASGQESLLAPLALVLFPLVTGVPAFVVALATMAILVRLRRHER
jgi:hypothetical protein